MQKLFWKTKRGKTIAATEAPFKTEDEFERFILETKEIFSDIFILKRQVRAPSWRFRAGCTRIAIRGRNGH
jgi:hypothetical protein